MNLAGSDLSPMAGDHHDDPFAVDYGLDFYAYLTPIIIVVGLFGNSVSLCIFKRRTIRKLSASVYLSAICISDTCVLFFILLDWLNKGLPRIGGSGARVPIVLRHGCCQAFLFFSYTFRIISVWLIIVFTFERYVSLTSLYRVIVFTFRIISVWLIIVFTFERYVSLTSLYRVIVFTFQSLIVIYV